MTTNVDENINTWLTQINNDYKVAISVDCVIFGYDEDNLKVLTIRCDMPSYEGEYSLVGDLVRPNETLDQSANRILLERTGFADVHMEQVQAFSDIDRHPLGRVITIAYYSLIKLDNFNINEIDNSDLLQWQNVRDVNSLAFDHKKIMDSCLQSLQIHLREKPIGFSLLPKKFSLKQLQKLYEVVLEIEIDKRNFRRKLRSLDILVDLDESQTEVSHRPAKLYTFDYNKYYQKHKSGFTFDL